jgi:hypothetical protein
MKPGGIRWEHRACGFALCVASCTHCDLGTDSPYQPVQYQMDSDGFTGLAMPGPASSSLSRKEELRYGKARSILFLIAIQ